MLFVTRNRCPALSSAFSTLGATLLLALPITAQAQTNLLANGSFENTANTFANNGAGGESLGMSSTAIPGWTTTNAELAWLVNGNNYGLASQSGSFFLDLTGYHDFTPYGGVTQSIATTVGTSYTLSFYLGANPSIGGDQGPMSALASAGGTSQSFTFAPSSGTTGNVYDMFSLPFTATTAMTAITITGTASGGGAYLGLDNVAVVSNAAAPSAPEPGSIVLLALSGLPVLGINARHRRRAALSCESS